MSIYDYENLKQQLTILMTIERPVIAQKLKEAREQGDLAENAEYDAAREEQAHIEAQIKKIKDMLDHAQIIQSNIEDASTVQLGSIVTYLLSNDAEGISETYTSEIVTTSEISKYRFMRDATQYDYDDLSTSKKISNLSPMGQSIIGHKVGDRVEYAVDLPKHEQTDTVKGIAYHVQILKIETKNKNMEVAA